ncbi:hypothetical protein E5D57_007290 [Metarhizium anisopliae]|nr:hypothetical protein E5D57_007290 [Metarhizium anisopliae]
MTLLNRRRQIESVLCHFLVQGGKTAGMRVFDPEDMRCKADGSSPGAGLHSANERYSLGGQLLKLF